MGNAVRKTLKLGNAETLKFLFSFLVFQLFSFCFLLPMEAANWYASTSGAPGNIGSLGSPWDLQTALNKTGVVLPGDTIWLRGGNYTHAPQSVVEPDDPGFIFRCILTGTAANPIWIRSYPGEWAKIDGGDWVHYFANGRPTLKLGVGVGSTQGDYVCVRDIEIYSSSTESRKSQTNDSDPLDINRSDGGFAVARGNKFINCVIHDVTAGISSFTDAGKGHEFYGNVIYNIGWQGTPNVHGHGFYCQGPINAQGLVKTIKRNITGGTYAHGGQIYGSGSGGGAEVSHFRISENTWIGSSGHGGLLIGAKNGGTTPDRLQDNQIFDNFFYGASLALYYEVFYFAYKDLRVTGNYLFNSKVTASSWESLVFTNNLLIDPVNILFGNVSINTSPVNPTGLLPWTWNFNSYVFSSPTYQGFGWDGVSFMNLTQWRATTGYDQNSTVVSTVPATNYVILQDNAYDTNRAHVIIYNWAGSSSIAVNVGSLNWGPGANVLVRNAQNYFGDTVNLPVSAANTLTLNMLAAAHTVAIPYGDTAAIDPKTFPGFGAFTLERTGASTEIPPPNYTVTIGSLNPNSGVAITFSPADLAGLGGASTSFVRTNQENTITAIGAPGTASGNTFSNWTRNGAFYSGSANTSFTNVGNATFVAVYATPVPPSTNYTVTVSSLNPSSGCTITVSPADNGGLGDGVTSFTRTNIQNRVTSLTCAVSEGVNTFARWERNGVLYSTVRAITFTNISNVSFTAVYATPPPPPNYVSSFTSHDPATVKITITPADNGGLASGDTPITRTNISGVVTSIEAEDPAVIGGNSFLLWLRDGVLYTTNKATTYTNTANVSFVALYTNSSFTVTVNSTGGTDCVINTTPADITGASYGITPFTRDWPRDTVVTLQSALADKNGKAMTGWLLDGVQFTTTLDATFTNNAAHTLTAVYEAAAAQLPGNKSSSRRRGTRF